MTGASALVQLRDEAMALIRATPALSTFAPLPAALTVTEKPVQTPAAVEQFLANPGTPIAATTAFTEAAIAAAPFAHWRQTYTEAEVGTAFLAQYAWMELWGPTGHFQCDDARAFVAFWGPNLYYDWHQHEPEEIYFLATGQAEFMAKGAPNAHVSPGETRLHTSNQPHATTIGDTPILTLVLWRGEGLTKMAKMTSKEA